MVSNKEQHIDLGPWENADFGKTFQETIIYGADENLPDEIRFIAGVAKLIKRCLEKQNANTDANRPSIFLLESKISSETTEIKPKRVPMLDNGDTTITGRLWFVSPVVVTGFYLELDDCDDDDLFKIVTDKLKLGSIPTVIFDPRIIQEPVRFYPHGLDKTENIKILDLHRPVSLDQIFDVITHVYNERFVTPEGQPKAGSLWQNNDKWWPVQNAEDMIQLYLSIGLTAAFPSCTIRHEQTAVTGRLDLEIEEKTLLNSNVIIRHAVLELKMLRSFNSSGRSVSEAFTKEWIESGVKQAASYRMERGAKASALCCFDMRKEDTGSKCFEHVNDLAIRLDVKLKRWYIYATSKDYRTVYTSIIEH